MGKALPLAHYVLSDQGSRGEAFLPANEDGGPLRRREGVNLQPGEAVEKKKSKWWPRSFITVHNFAFFRSPTLAPLQRASPVTMT